MGTLKITGKIDLTQFWPNGSSDADTTTLLLSINANSFAFATDGVNFTPTTAFVNASTNRQDIDGKDSSGRKSSNYLIKQADGNTSHITIRLQGIDAPELHYMGKITPAMVAPFAGTPAQKEMAMSTLDKEYKQFRGETATVLLYREISLNGIKNELICEFISHNITTPADVIDKYNRFVGEIEVKYDNGKRKNINRWLLKNGWVFPTFYDSMLDSEINDFVALWNEGKAKPQSVWRFYKDKMENFDFELLYNKKTAINQPVYDAWKDRGLTMFPKLFRRYIHYAIMQKAGLGVPVTFQSYLQNFNNTDLFYLRNDFLAHPNTAVKQHLSQHLPADTFNLDPSDLILKESGSGDMFKNGIKVLQF